MSMTEKNKIIIIESSEIIQQGLETILNSSLPDIDIVLFGNISELHLFKHQNDIDLIIINCALIEMDYTLLDTKFQYTPYIGMVTNNFWREHKARFNDLIYLTDSAEKIIKIIKNQLSKQRQKKKRLNVKLTNRELDVLKLLIKGYSNKQIASELHISIHTVISHRQKITTKLDIKSTAGLTIYGVINNIVDIDEYLDQ